ncbi:MAG: hypothetical protein VKJ64_20915 [Leptolyngbyaceae bacterium]|nr:hypothetical protein [Leptolyngbyaceae bacterium]
MSIQQLTGLFTDLSSEASSQTKGGMGWNQYSSSSSRIIVRFRYNPAPASSSTQGSTINITNPEFDDGSIINLGGGGAGINISNPDIDDGATLSF